jgi:hypothetical protein
MRILDYLDRLEVLKRSSSQVVCICPVCGDDSFKISTSSVSYGAYRCWTNQCSTEDIKTAINYQTVSPLFSLPKTFRAPLKTVSPIPFTGIRICSLEKHRSIASSWKTGISNSEDLVQIKKTIYPYSPTQRLLRWDIYESKASYKRPVIQTKGLDGYWVNGVLGGREFWPLYVGFSEPKDDGNTVLIVEGEKTCEYVKDYLEIFAVTLSSLTFNQPESNKALAFKVFFTSYPFITNAIFIPDLDEPGLKKAKGVEQALWSINIGYKVVPLDFFIDTSSKPSGFDLADITADELIILKNIFYDIGNPDQTFAFQS